MPLIKPLQVTRIDSVSGASPYLDDWRALAAGMPMRLPEWQLGWWESYASTSDELWLLFLHTPEGALVGVAPLYLRGRGGAATLRLLGTADACSHHPDWLAIAGSEALVGAEVARFLLDCKSSWKLLFFESVDVDAAALHATVDLLAEHGCLRHQRQINSCWKIALPATWDDYLQMLSRSLRKRCRKLQRQFFDSGRVRIRQAESETDLREGFEVLLKLHAERWGSAKNPLGVFSDRRFRSFHEKVSRALLAQGKLRLAWLEVDGLPLAIEYQFVDATTLYAYQAGIDLSMREYSPGKLTMMAAVQFALAHGCSTFDLLRGDESYKANWRAMPSECYELRVWQRNFSGRKAWGMWHLYTFAARRLTPVIPSCFINAGLKFFHLLKKH